MPEDVTYGLNPTFALRAKIWAETPVLSLQALQYQ